ncbi:MAG: hypothetical protein ACREE0_15340 [Phenylobacterium sp.]
MIAIPLGALAVLLGLVAALTIRRMFEVVWDLILSHQAPAPPLPNADDPA